MATVKVKMKVKVNQSQLQQQIVAINWSRSCADKCHS